jgi:hypothetical protein
MDSAVRARGMHFFIVLHIAFLLCSCAAPQYDSKADAAISDLQSKLHGQIDGWISKSKPASYTKNVAFYDGVDTDLKSLELRMEATPDPSTANLPIIFSNLSNQITTLRKTHEETGTPTEFFLLATQQQLDAQFAALLTYELSLKTSGPMGATTQSTATNKNPSKLAAQ